MEHLTVIPNPRCEEDIAKVFLDESLLEVETSRQISAMISNPALSHARIMPDCHVGHGCCIGFTTMINCAMVVPSYVGGDIGCGILTYPLNSRRLNLAKVESRIKNTIPMGNGHMNVHKENPVEPSYIENYLRSCQDEVDLLCGADCNDETLPITFEYFVQLCEKIGMNVDTCIRSFGTLGGGNHFIEINQDPSNSEYFLTVHSGSRAFGMKLFEYHNSKVDKSLRCLGEADSRAYCIDMIIAQQLARMNRHIMLQLILRDFQFDYDESRLIESTHNYIDFRRTVLRKGAISAEEGELCIVALNMKDGILICRGKGNEDWNYSCAHGCGRHMSRSEARRRIKMKDYKKVMRDVVSTSVCEETLDEAPQAYKDMDLIIAALEPTVNIEKHLISVINLKGKD
jgi:tRNA-splicing ligase RtcB (3'-phosphate/5'-hydroxy nucleic acid ligase)